MQTEPLTQTPPQPDADPVAQVQAGALPQTRDGPPSEAKPAELAPIEAKPAELAPIDLRASISQAGLELIETNKQSEPELQDAPPKNGRRAPANGGDISQGINTRPQYQRVDGM
ncbi:MAG: hypothetical protein EBU15_06400 [Betaproteobacteria bacterium]|nr:hypothetical protein [Betaproteobacteria bacterium]